MSLEYYFRAPNGNTTQIDDDRVRLYTLDVTANADEGSIGVSELVIDDPEGDFDIVGHRVFGVKETQISASSNTFVYVGYTAERKISRGPYRNGVGRQWKIQLTDINTVFERRVMVGSDCNRPAETDVARVQWLEATAEGALIDDTRYLSTADPVQMDACDYRGQTFKDVIDDCAQQSGKNYYLTYFGDVGVSPWGRFSLWYGHASSTDYSSTISLSNDLADVDGVTTFAVSIEETELTRDPSRVYSGVYMPYDGGTAYVQNADTANTFARRDAVSPAENVKTAAKANARGNRYLADIATEEDVIKTSFQVPAAYVNHLREGMRVSAKFTHLPGYETASWMRVLNRNVVQDSELTYTITVELSPTGDSVHSGSVAYIVASADGELTRWASIEGSDDGASWTAVIPRLDEGSIAAGLWEVPLEHQEYRYWSVHYSAFHGGGAFGGFAMQAIRLLNGAGVDALGTQGTSAPPGTPDIDWPLRSPVILVGPEVPYTATTNGDRAQLYGHLNSVFFEYIYPGPQAGDFSYPSGTASFGLKLIVVAAGAVDARWVWDLGA